MSQISDLERLLNDERKLAGAASCTFYAQDPFWIDDFRLICMPGVSVTEPMYGWTYDERSRTLFCDSGPERFCHDVNSEFPPEEQGFEMPSKLPRSYLFNGFADREGVKSFARFQHVNEANAIDAVMFVNFREQKAFDEDERVRLRRILHKAMDRLPGVIDELRALDAEHVAESLRIIRLTQEMAGLIHAGDDGLSSVHSQLTSLVESSLEALRIPPSAGIGTIHFYDPDRHTIQLNVAWPASDSTMRLRHSARLDNDLMGWIVVMRKPVLINNLDKSPFRELQRYLPDNISSILAVPMLVNDNVAGVLTLASTENDAFRTVSVRSVWYAANSAAFSVNSARIASTTRRLLKIGQDATADQSGAKRAMSAVAELLNETLGADSCDIWHYNSFFGRFDAAATLEDRVPVIRTDGWTKYIRSTKLPVWLSAIRSETDFSARYWHDGWSAESSRGADALPDRISREALDRNIGAQLGLPIMVSNECAGVAWIKYFNNPDPEPIRPPYETRMAEIFSVASQAGLVFELIQRQIEGGDRSQLRIISEKLKPYSESCSLNFSPLALEGYIIHKPFHAHVCGDFHVLSHVDASVVGLLIGDGEGKAVAGLLNALPLITGFESFGSGSGSTRYVVDRLRAVSRKLGLKGTVLYWTFTQINKEIWLTMTSAGHVRPILIRDGAHRLPRDEESPALGTPLGIDLNSPLLEHVEKLTPGDTLIAFTDGVSDAFSADESESDRESMDRIMGISLQNSGLSCEKLAGRIMNEAERTNPFSDDAMICVIRYPERRWTK